MAAELARKRKQRGLKLNHPESVALIADHILEGARDGKSVSELMSSGKNVLKKDDVLPGVLDIIHESEEGTVRLSIEGVGASLVKIFEMSYGVAQYFVGLEGTTALFNDGVRINVLIPDLDDASPDTLITKEYVQDNGDATLRPASPSAGRFYFDTDLNKPIWYSGSSWVDATGATV